MFKNCAAPVQFAMQELCGSQVGNPSKITARVPCSLLNIFFDIFKNAKQVTKIWWPCAAPSQFITHRVLKYHLKFASRNHAPELCGSGAVFYAGVLQISSDQFK